MAYQQRGKRILTAQETKFYETIAKAGKSDNPKQYFATLDDPNDKIMPTTVIEDLYFPDDGSNTVHHMGNQHFMQHGAENSLGAIADLCAANVINEFNKGG